MKKYEEEEVFFEKFLRENLHEFTEILDEHKRDNDGVIPHILTYDLLLFTIKALEEKNENVLVKIGDLIENLIKKNYYFNNMISVSFLENLDFDQPYYEKLSKYFKPETLKEANKMKGFSVKGKQ